MGDMFSVIIEAMKTAGTALGLNYILIISFAALILAIIIQTVVAECSLESRTARAVVKIEEYLENNPFITNENIVEFNRLMKRIPKTLRTRWQQYVVNRTKKPSDFLNEEDCIEKPFKTKGFAQAISVFKNILIILTAVSFIFSANSIESNNIVTAITQSAFIPASLITVGFIYLTLLKLRHNNVRIQMYLNFNDMTKLLDRAVTTYPDFVDYEILFTKKEIDAMIPELQEYLRQRALREQEQLEEAKAQQVEHENYDFSAIGTDGALVMERAVKECEFYLGNRRKTLATIEQLQAEKDLLTRNYDEKNKISQRKLRDINETLDRLRDNLNKTTNKIEGNNIRRKQAEEVTKQQNIEREIEEDNNKYNEELKKVNEQIKAKHEEILKGRQYVETAFNNEFKAYSDKVYEKLYNIANEKVKDNVETVIAENQTLKQELEERDTFINERNNLFNEKQEQVENATKLIDNLQTSVKQYEEYKQQAEEYMSSKDKELEGKNQEIFALTNANENLKKNLELQERKYKELRKQKVKEITRYFDANGNEFFYDQNGLPYFYDQNGTRVYYYKNGIEQKFETNMQEDSEENIISESKELETNNYKQDQLKNLNIVNLDEIDFEDNDKSISDDNIKQKDSVSSIKNDVDDNEVKNQELKEKTNSDDEDEAEFKRLLDEYLKEDKEGIIADDYDLDETDEQVKKADIEKNSPSINDWVAQQEDNAYFERLDDDTKVEEDLKEQNKKEDINSNPDEQLKDIKKAIDEEIKKLEQEHNKLATNMNNVAKELNIENKNPNLLTEDSKPTSANKLKTKQASSKKSTAKKEIEKEKNVKKSMRTKTAKNEAVDKKVDVKADAVKKETNKKNVNAKNIKSKKPNKTSSKKTATISKKLETTSKKPTTVVKTENQSNDKNINIGFEDFGKELNQALADADKNSKKNKK